MSGRIGRLSFLVIGLLSAFLVVFLLGSFVAMILHLRLWREAGEEIQTYVMLGGVVMLGVVTLVMIIHLNLTTALSEEEKRSWRSILSFAGPIAPCFYFLRMGRAPKARLLQEMGKETWNRPFGRR